MSQIAPSPGARQRRADAERSIAAILDAAVEVLSERPDASMEDIATAAGVARQTVYAHYASREALLGAVLDRSLARAVAAIDAAAPDEGPPAAALERLLDASWQTLERHARLVETLRASLGAGELHARHAPILVRLERLVQRGQRAGAFDRRLPRSWLLAATIGLAHSAAAEVAAGRMNGEAAGRALKRSVARVYGAGG